jgi:hypothetical protein
MKHSVKFDSASFRMRKLREASNSFCVDIVSYAYGLLKKPTHINDVWAVVVKISCVKISAHVQSRKTG